MKEFSITKRLFGGEVEIVIKGIEPIFCEDIIESVYGLGLALEKKFNFFDENSELSKLNKKRFMEVSEDLKNVLEKSLVLCKLTSGQYDVTIGKQIAGRKKGFDINSVNCSYKDVEIEGNKVRLVNDEVLIDLGSIAKGYITDKMIESLISRGVLSGLIDARGDIRVFGNEDSFIKIQHPRDKDKTIRTIKLKNMSVATSGDYNQYIENFDNSHIINKKDLISISVVASNLEDADVYATALFVLNKEEREKIINQNKNIKVLTINSDFNIDYYNGFKNLICEEINEN